MFSLIILKTIFVLYRISLCKEKIMKAKLLSPVNLFFVIVLLFSSVAAVPMAQQSESQKYSIIDTLNDLGGLPCFDGSAFTCVTIEVPLDHFDPDNGQTIPVTFAVLPASGARKGMFVTATGGPGYSGIASADSYVAAFDPSITDAFDIVFFDQRGIASSGDQSCPYAANVFYQQDARGVTRKQETALKQSASTFVSDCINETSDPSLLQYLGTKQAVEDLEYFRQVIGDEKLWLYGESYGTQYAQTYAAAHSEHLAGLILDGTVDLTLDGISYYGRQAQAFNDTMVATLAACKDDPACAKDINGKPLKAYDALQALLKKEPIAFKFPLPYGGFEKRRFSLTNLEFVAASQMYNEGDRMMFTRALAAFASAGDIVPLARLLYLDLGVDPQTLDVVPDPFFSDAAYFGVECQDYGYSGNSPDQKAKNYLRAADPYEASIPRLASLVYGDLPCAYWPNATTDLTRPDYLAADGIPTLVLGATADPATPVDNGIHVYQHLADGYLITQQAGPHVIFGRGNTCPDALVTDFLVNDIVPTERETVCDGYVMDAYIPNAPRAAKNFQSPYKALSSVETEIYYLPEFYYWDGFEPASVGCSNGGVLGFAPSAISAVYDFTLTKCAFASDFIMSGNGSYNVDTDEFLLKVSTTGRWKCDLEYTRSGENVSVKGKCDGKPVKENRHDDDHDQHHAPDRQEQNKENREH